MNHNTDSIAPKDAATGPRDGYARSRWLTVPNALTALRLAGSGTLLWLASDDRTAWFIAVYAVLLLTDWLDGKIAILFHQRTALGARLDSIADAVLYACLLVGIAWLHPEFVREQSLLIGIMLGSYALLWIAVMLRFHRMPAFHTRAAKTCWLLVSIGAITLLAGGPDWPAIVALLAVIITNAEALAISFVLKHWRTDVPTIWHAVRLSGRKR